MRGTPRSGERNNETSRLALETSEKERDVCLTDGGETRCHVAFRNFGLLGTSAVFIVLLVRASIFFSRTPLVPLFSALDSRSESAKGARRCKRRGSFRRSSTDVFIPDGGIYF